MAGERFRVREPPPLRRSVPPLARRRRTIHASAGTRACGGHAASGHPHPGSSGKGCPLAAGSNCLVRIDFALFAPLCGNAGIHRALLPRQYVADAGYRLSDPPSHATVAVPSETQSAVRSDWAVQPGQGHGFGILMCRTRGARHTYAGVSRRPVASPRHMSRGRNEDRGSTEVGGAVHSATEGTTHHVTNFIGLIVPPVSTTRAGPPREGRPGVLAATRGEAAPFRDIRGARPAAR